MLHASGGHRRLTGVLMGSVKGEKSGGSRGQFLVGTGNMRLDSAGFVVK